VFDATGTAVSDIGKAIDRLIGLELAPYLKSMGFKKKARDFYRVDAESIAVINVQASQGNAGEKGRFTINVGRYFPAIAKVQDKTLSGSHPKEYECTVRERLGALMDGNDKWWVVDTATDNAEIASELRYVVERFAMPWLQRIATLSGLRQNPARSQPLTEASLAFLFGDRESAIRLAREFRKDRPMAASAVEVWAQRNGLDIK
jgi:hypothetical protein